MGVNICVKHACKLEKTSYIISSSGSPRPLIAEEEIGDVEAEFISREAPEYVISKYICSIFNAPIDFQNNVPIGKYLDSKLEGTEYLSTRGKMRNISKLYEDYCLHCSKYGFDETKKYVLGKLFTGHNFDFVTICTFAHFLGVSVEELTNPVIPSKSQCELFDEKVKQLRREGKGCDRIARELNVSKSAIVVLNRHRKFKARDYSVRKGMHRDNWPEMDKNSIDKVKETCEMIYYNNGGRPGRVSQHTVCKRIGWPTRRLDLLPLCRTIVIGYEETYPEYWAREVVWTYNHLIEIGVEPKWSDILLITHLKRSNFKACFPYLEKFCDKDIADAIMQLIK